MKSLRYILFSFIPILFCNNSCEYEEGQRFIVVNNSDEEIVVTWSYYSPIPKESGCIKPVTKDDLEELIYTNMVEPNSRKNFERIGLGEWLMSPSNDTLHIGIFNFTDIDTMTCEEFENVFPIKQEWAVTLEDMESYDWTLVYPGSENINSYMTR